MQLYIGNKNYSSWSLRPWLLMRQSGIDFDEKKLRLAWHDDSDFKRTLLALAPSGRVPLLVDDGFAVWDSLAIAEYLAERFAQKALWPADAKARARARCLCAEMHSGFSELRTLFPMNVEADLHEAGLRVVAENAAARRDIERIDSMWQQQLGASGGPFLFGGFGTVDAYFAPVASRITTYALPVSAASAAYVERIQALPAMQAWRAEALAENDFLAVDEPYRSRRS